jgi:hypothetical protein
MKFTFLNARPVFIIWLILFFHFPVFSQETEIDKISVDTQSGKIKLIKPDLTTFSSLISKYGVDKVAKANQIEELYQQQVKDGKEEFIA